MQKKRRVIPFSWLPGSWGLKGKAFDEKAAYYYYEGKDLDQRLAEIKFDKHTREYKKAMLDIELKYVSISPRGHAIELLKLDIEDHNSFEFERRMLLIDARFGVISDYDCDMAFLEVDKREAISKKTPMTAIEYELAKLNIAYSHDYFDEYDFDIKCAEVKFDDQTSKEFKLAIVEIEFKHEKITKHEFDKLTATINEEPWVAIVEQGFDPDQGLAGVFIEFDWNEYWIEYLKLNGFVGHNDDQIIEQWFLAVCKSQYQNAQYQDGSVIPFNGRIVNKTDF